MTIRYFILIMLCLWGATPPASAETVGQIQAEHQQVMQKEIDAQQAVDNWAMEREALVNELLDLNTQLEWNKFQEEKFAQYVAHKKNTIIDLSRRKEQLQLLRMALEPFLQGRIERLQAVVDEDLPFLPLERSERLSFLRESLADPDIALSEKLRRVLDAMQVEAGYGNSVEVTEEKQNLNGQPTIVQILRLGRIGLFYLTIDGKEAGWWHPQRRQWTALKPDEVRTVQTTLDIVHHKRAAQLIDLPLPAITATTGEGAQ